MKLTRHNGRSGKNGAYNPKHNDRRFDVENSEHIDGKRLRRNVYWDCYQGFHYPEDREQEERIIYSFEQVEEAFYYEHYDAFCEAQHERNRKNGHPERDRSTDDLRTDRRTCPEESLIQIGTMEQSASAQVLTQIATEFFEEFERRFGKHVHILDWSLHLDEATPHIHERHIFDCPNRYGEIAPQQEKALEALGIDLPYPDRKPGKNNNRKMTFDAACRTLLFDIALEHGLHLDREPSYGGRKYLEKNDFILMNQEKKKADRERLIGEGLEKLEAIEEGIRREDIRLQSARERREKEEGELEETADFLFMAKRELRQVTGRVGAGEEKLEEQKKQISDNRDVLAGQEEMMEKNREKLEWQDDLIGEKDRFISDVVDAAYQEAVRVVTEKVIEETHNTDFNMVDSFRENVGQTIPMSPGMKHVVTNVLAKLLEEFKGLTKHISERLAAIFADPKEIVRMKEPIRKAVRDHLAEHDSPEEETYSAPVEHGPCR